MTRTQTSKPIAVLISDIHFTPATLEEATQSLLKAQFKAKMLDVPLVIMGDTLDSKAIIRAECANKIIQLLSVGDAPETIVLVGNHDRINEKSVEHSLNFIKPYCTVVDSPRTGFLCTTPITVIPYQSDIAVIKAVLEDSDHKSEGLVLMHQGIQGSSAGHYIQDKTAIPQDWVKSHRVISGHYHARQDIDCTPEAKYSFFPHQGIFSYVGNPYTLGFGEANDPEKGYQILYDDGSLEFVPTKLRRHRVIICGWDEKHDLFWPPDVEIQYTDIVWIKVEGPTDRLSITTKEWLKTQFHIPGDFRLDLIPNDTKSELKSIDTNVSKSDILDSVIDNLQNTLDERKSRLKQLWRKFT